MPMKYAMDLSRVEYVVYKLMSTPQVARVSYLISSYNIVTCYIMGPNPDGNRPVRLTHRRIMLAIIELSNEVVGCR